MKYNLKYVRSLLMCCCILTLWVNVSLCIEDAIIAIVNEETITIKDLKDYISAVYSQLKMDGRHTEDEIHEIMAQVQYDGINRLIDDRLILSAANIKGVEAHRASIDQKINEIRARYHSEQIFLSSLASEGITITDLRERISDQLKMQFFIETEIKSTVQVNPREITDYYNENIEKFIQPEQADLQSIFIPYDGNPDAARHLANTAYGQLKMGNDFNDIMKSYSKTPSIGKVARGQMKPHIEDQIFNLKPGEFTWPIESEQGVFIFKLQQKFPGKTFPLNEIKDQIAQILFNIKFKEKMDVWLKDAREKNYIEIKTN